ncbi:MAG: LamG domain-containing protein [Sedimentisphaerales bacterium]|nr:LamG domain-containing protein [Sedimentisphaerales bacterium]
MRNCVRWVVLTAVLLASVSAFAAAWNPDTDADLLFNMNFQTYNNGAHTTTDAKGGLVGTVYDYNATYPNLFGEDANKPGLGYDGNFAAIHDIATGSGSVSGGIPSPNDVKLKVPSGTAVFDLSVYYDIMLDKHTWTFWFNVPTLVDGTVIRHASVNSDPCSPWYEDYKNDVWEIRIYGGKLQFYHKNNCLRMETASMLSEYGLDVNTWYHAAVVIDRSDCEETSVPTTQLSSKIYVDGLEVPVIVTSYNTDTMNVDTYYDSPLWIGAGEREFDGLLDEVRLYSRTLTPVEVSILNQPDTTIPRALLPIPRSENVVITTDLTWDAADGATSQIVYFGTDPENLAQIASGSGTLESADPCAGLLALNTEYFWYVNSNGVDGPLWSFITETGKALNPSPADGEEDVNNADVDLSWTTPTTATYTVYASTIRSDLESPDFNWFANGLTDPCVDDFDPCSIGGRGEIYYWRVDCNYASVGTVWGDIWSFRTDPYDLVFNTSGYAKTFADHSVAAYGCEIHGAGWTSVTTGSLEGTFADGNAIAVFNFPSGFNYDRKYDIIVIPAYRAKDINSTINFPTPLSINVTGDFYFDGRIQIAGDDTLTNTQDNTFARCGGFPGPKHNQNESIFSNDPPVPVTDYWTSYPFPNYYHHRYGNIGVPSTDKFIYVPTALAQRTFGPGQPVNPPYKGGGGGGSGGVGGEAGRGYYFGVFSGGPSYGDEEVPIPFGGSSGGWGAKAGGSAGGGGIEIIADGNVILDSNSQIRAFGGGQLYSTASGDGAAGGGGAGGSVRIIAGGSVTNRGIINVNGGKGGNANTKANNPSGGGGGGRVAIFYGTTIDLNDGTITANGGAKGTYQGYSIAENGKNGTIFITNGSPKKASAPTPANGDKMVYCSSDPCTIKLKWYSGYGGTTDEVFCDTFSPPTTSRGSASATRGRHEVNMTVSPGNTYYWKVKTDGDVNSDPWSFKTVSWRCEQYAGTDPNHVGGPEWDSNHDCVLNFEDFWYFAKDWYNNGFGDYRLDHTFVGGMPGDGIPSDLARWANEWLECYNRTDSGCAGW